jgi:hypothetical protein
MKHMGETSAYSICAAGAPIDLSPKRNEIHATVCIDTRPLLSMEMGVT